MALTARVSQPLWRAVTETAAQGTGAAETKKNTDTVMAIKKC